jgi:hypothetical protein
MHEADQIGKFYGRNQDGNMVPLDTLLDIEQTGGPNFVSRFKPLSGCRDYGCARAWLQLSTSSKRD